MTEPRGTRFWPTVWILLKSARRRFGGRRLRQQQLMRHRGGRNATDWGFLGTVLSVVVMLVMHGAAAATLFFAVQAGERLAVEQSGKMVVSRNFLNLIQAVEGQRLREGWSRDAPEVKMYETEARSLARDTGQSKEEVAKKLRDTYIASGPDGFVTKRSAAPGMRVFAKKRWNRLPAMLGSIVLLWWALMLTFQGEGMELDLNRRRHPMWEWLFSHPVPVGAVFLAEMFAPLAANPIYWTAPLFPGVVYGLIYGPKIGMLAALVVGVPLAVASGCAGKAIEIWVTLRVAPRQRGAVIGVMSWLGYASMMVLFLGTVAAPKLSTMVLRWLEPLARVPWPWLGLFLGLKHGDEFSFAMGAVTCLAAAVVVIAGSVWLSVTATQRGLAGAFGASDRRPTSRPGPAKFGREPLYRKELLWFVRDRSAIVQSILIPLTVAGVQVFNLRGLMKMAQGEWNYLSGAAIVFGTYFLWILGPKSLASEGTALWIALTWPRGLESLLKAKAWLWAMLSNVLVALMLLYAAALFPHDRWRIALVGVAWVIFGRSMAEKSVTLVTVTSESGEVQRLRGGSRAGSQLGMLTFATGVLTQQWQIAAIGIVYSYLTAAAMWQNFRARLPFLYDPWSEEVPDPPTLVTAMVAISVMVELGALITGVTLAFAGRDNAPIARAAGYGISAVVVWLGTVRFLDHRGLSLGDIWFWSREERKPVPRDGFAGSIYGLSKSFDELMAEAEREPWWKAFAKQDAKSLLHAVQGAGMGLALGLIGWGYTASLMRLPWTAEMMRKAQQEAQNFPHWHLWHMVMAVGFAPFAEEYLFRGLLFRALDREWGGWKAVVGSAAFFAIYHPPLAWPLVFTLGAVNALLYRRMRSLTPLVLLHMAYNAVVLSR